MQVFMNTDHARDLHVKEVIRLKASGSYEEMKKYIRPYLIDGEIYKETKEEFYKELLQTFSEEDAYEILQQDHPDVSYIEWNGFKVIFILDWTSTYWSLDAWDYVTMDMQRRWNVSEEELFILSVKNMKLEPTKYRHLTSEELSGLDLEVLLVEADLYVIPKYTASIILVSSIMARFEEILGAFYMIPYSKEKLILVAKKHTKSSAQVFELKDKVQLSTIIQDPFTEKALLYENGSIKILS